MFAIQHVFMYVYKTFILYLRRLCSDALSDTKHKFDFIDDIVLVLLRVCLLEFNLKFGYFKLIMYLCTKMNN